MTMVKYELGKNYPVSFLLLLYDYKLYNEQVDEKDKKRVTTSTFAKISTRYGGLADRARELAEKGLIKIEEKPNPRIKEAFELTREGIKIAEQLKEIEEDMEQL